MRKLKGTRTRRDDAPTLGECRDAVSYITDSRTCEPEDTVTNFTKVHTDGGQLYIIMTKRSFKFIIS